MMTRYWHKFLALVVGVFVLVGGCTAAAHLEALQTPSVPSSSPLSLPRLTSASVFQRGIDIDFYTYPGQDIMTAAAKTVDYAHHLHANAIAISFPFFMTNRYAVGVERGPATPTPHQLAVVIVDARHAGMRVTLRPLLDEKALGGARAHWVPANEASWFTSYWHFLAPYLAMAQRLHVSEFIAGTELTEFSHSRQWDKLNIAIRHIYHGQLGCADNWHVETNGCGTKVQLVDAYQPLLPSLATAWMAYDTTFPRGTVLAEVGIAAVDGAWIGPYIKDWPGAVLDPDMQAEWFTAACQAAIAKHLGGIYFWSLGLSVQQTGPTLTDESQWAYSSGASAIARCFTSIEKGIS